MRSPIKRDCMIDINGVWEIHEYFIDWKHMYDGVRHISYDS